jgi:hypothetical protein
MDENPYRAPDVVPQKTPRPADRWRRPASPYFWPIFGFLVGTAFIAPLVLSISP